MADFAVKDLASVPWARIHADTLALKLCRARDDEKRVKPGGSIEAAACTPHQEHALAAEKQRIQAKLQHEEPAG